MGHRCQKQEFRVITIREDQEFEIEAAELEEEAKVVAELKLIEVENPVELSKKSVHEFSTPRTMKFKGEIKGEPVVVLIDCGATHNFVSIAVVEGLWLPRSLTREYDIVMGTGNEVRSQGICRGVKLKLLKITIQAES